MCTTPSPPPARAVGPVQAAASKLAPHLQPLASTLRTTLPAAAPALDAAASSLSRGSAGADAGLAALGAELQTPEARELRTAAARLAAAAAALAGAWAARALAWVERAAGVPPPAADGGEGPASLSARSARVAGALLRRGVAAGQERVVRAVRGGGGGEAGPGGKVLREVCRQVASVAGSAASKVATYRGEYHATIVPVAQRVADMCGAVAPARAADSTPPGETVGTLPFSPYPSDSSLANLDKTD